jgi:hypothetical protein
MSTLTDQQQALEALEALRECITCWPDETWAPHEFAAMDRSSDAITALRAALEQQEQEPVAWMLPRTDSIITAATKVYRGVLAENYTQPLFAHPPRREWVSLTEEEVWSQYQTLWPFHPAEEPRLAADISKFARAIERACKERNT